MAEFVAVVVPAWARWGQRRGLLLPGFHGRGPNGHWLCRWCDNECQPPRTRWCSDDCVRAYERVASWPNMRAYVMARDGAKCARCGTTTPSTSANHRFDPWDVDHIVRVVDGGTDDPANLRLLCLPCHVSAGYEQRAERSGQLALTSPTPSHGTQQGDET